MECMRRAHDDGATVMFDLRSACIVRMMMRWEQTIGPRGSWPALGVDSSLNTAYHVIFWGELMQTASYLGNRVPPVAQDNVTPLKAPYGEETNLAQHRATGPERLCMWKRIRGSRNLAPGRDDLSDTAWVAIRFAPTTRRSRICARAGM